MNHWRQIKWGKQLINVSKFVRIGSRWLLRFSDYVDKEKTTKNTHTHTNWKVKFRRNRMKPTKKNSFEYSILRSFFPLLLCLYIHYDTWMSKTSVQSHNHLRSRFQSSFMKWLGVNVLLPLSHIGSVSKDDEEKPKKNRYQIDWLCNGNALNM